MTRCSCCCSSCRRGCCSHGCARWRRTWEWRWKRSSRSVGPISANFSTSETSGSRNIPDRHDHISMWNLMLVLMAVMEFTRPWLDLKMPWDQLSVSLALNLALKVKVLALISDVLAAWGLHMWEPCSMQIWGRGPGREFLCLALSIDSAAGKLSRRTGTERC